VREVVEEEEGVFFTRGRRARDAHPQLLNRANVLCFRAITASIALLLFSFLCLCADARHTFYFPGGVLTRARS